MKTRYSLLLFALALIGIGATTYTITQLTENATPGAGTIIEIYDPTATPKSGKITLDSAGFRTAAGVTAAFIQANQTNATLASLLYQATNSMLTRLSAETVGLTDEATIATDASAGCSFRVTLGGNRTLGNPSNPLNGQRIVWELIQDGSGNRTITLGNKFALGTDISSVTLTTTASKRDFLTVIYNSTTDKFYLVGISKGY